MLRRLFTFQQSFLLGLWVCVALIHEVLLVLVHRLEICGTNNVDLSAERLPSANVYKHVSDLLLNEAILKRMELLTKRAL